MTTGGTKGTFSANGSTTAFVGDGTIGWAMFKGNFDGGRIDLEISPDNGTSYYKTGDFLTKPQAFRFNPGRGVLVRWTLSQADTPDIDYVITKPGV